MIRIIINNPTEILMKFSQIKYPKKNCILDFNKLTNSFR
jgi:hypothetical protein